MKDTNDNREPKTPVGSTDLVAAIAPDAPAAQMTIEKAEWIMERDKMIVTGFMLTCPKTGMVGIVDKSAVRWLSREDWWWLMHVSESPLAATVEVSHGADHPRDGWFSHYP